MQYRRLLNKSLLLAALTSGLLASACSDEVTSLGQQRSAIAGGVDSGPEDDAVVRLFKPAVGELESSTCSAALIAPNLLVTALHCISVYTDGVAPFKPFRCTADGKLENSGDGAGTFASQLPPEQLTVHSGGSPSVDPVAVGERILGSGSTTICNNDIGFMVLDQELDLPILPIRLDGEVRVADSISAVGYGFTGLSEPTMRRRRDDIRVNDVDLPPRTFGVGQGPCKGDSGGPALSSEGAVVGVFSMTNGDCASDRVRNTYTQLMPFKNLALQAFEAAGAEPWLEGASGPGEEPDAGVAGAAGAAGGPGAGGEPSTGGAPSAGGAPSNAGAPSSTGGASTGGSAPTGRRRSSGESGCRLAASPVGSSGWAALVLVGAAGLTRRRRRGSSR